MLVISEIYTAGLTTQDLRSAKLNCFAVGDRRVILPDSVQGGVCGHNDGGVGNHCAVSAGCPAGEMLALGGGEATFRQSIATGNNGHNSHGAAAAVGVEADGAGGHVNHAEIAGVVGLFIAVVLLVEHAECLAGHIDAGKVDFCRAAVAVRRAVQLRNASVVVNIAVLVLEDGGNILVFTRCCIGILNRYLIVGNGLCSCGKFAAVLVFQRQLPFAAGIIANGSQTAVHTACALSAHSGRGKEDSVQI